jgi:hypothetical protein
LQYAGDVVGACPALDDDEAPSEVVVCGEAAAVAAPAVFAIRSEGMSRRDLTERSQISYSYLSAIENGVKQPRSSQ